MKRGACSGLLGGALFLISAGCSGGGGSTPQAPRPPYALRFFGSGAGQDRALLTVDDDLPGAASTPLDVGAGDFTLELWLRGKLANNPTSHAGGARQTPDAAWLAGNVLLDRDGRAHTGRGFGVGIAGGRVRFGTGPGDGGVDQPDTLEGDVDLLDDRWHHVALVRERASGIKRIYVDGQLDFESLPDTSTDDLSYPDSGGAGAPDPEAPRLVLAAARLDDGPAFDGFVDELRVWSRALNRSEILSTYDRAVPPDAVGLAGWYRFEEGAGTLLADSSSAGSPAGELRSGRAGNGQWVDSSPVDQTAPVSDGPLPPGFLVEEVDEDLVRAVTVACAPDGRVFVGEHAGRVLAYRDGERLPQPVLQVPTTVTLEARGLLSIALDPAFTASGHLYAYYITPEPRARVSRFTVVGDVASPGSEVVLWENLEPAGNDHLGGGLVATADGHLYISTGEHFDSLSSQDLGSELGKLLRIRVDGTVPGDNPFFSVPGAQPTIWARGLRNPFRLRRDPLDGTVWISDVGGNKAGAREELDRARRGANYGWPFQEGSECQSVDCTPYTASEYEYVHSDPAYFTLQEQGAIVVGPVVRHTRFPDGWQGDVIVGDFANGWIRRVLFDGAGQAEADAVIVPAEMAAGVVDLDLDPAGNVWYVTFGSGHHPSSLHRLAYAGGANLPPVPEVEASVVSGLPPLEVTFDGTRSRDPDRGPGALRWQWDFGDGTGSSERAPVHTYTAPGAYHARLTVDDGELEVTSETLVIQVGNRPVPTIATPSQGTVYRAGDVVAYTGSAIDVEDGVLGGASLSWSVDLVHAVHAHSRGASHTGTAGDFTVPRVGHGPENTYYEIVLTATDSDGLTGTARREVHGVPAPIVLETFPSGIPVLFDGQAEPTPRNYVSLPGFRHRVRAQSGFLLGLDWWLFDAWSDGGGIVHPYVAPEGGATLRADYVLAVDQTIVASVAASDRNAQWSVATGQRFGRPSDPFSLTVGRTSAGVVRSGLEFSLPVPQGSLILSARLELIAADDQLGQPAATMWVYDTSDAPPFVLGSPVDLVNWAPLATTDVLWTFEAFAPGACQPSPELSGLLQPVVDRPDWTAGGHVGLVLDGAASPNLGQRTFRNADSGLAPQLHVTFVPGGGPLPSAQREGR